jgi:energy-coupling factor transport system ATP-binding protein
LRENITNTKNVPSLLQIKNLHFAYKEQDLLLSNIELNIKPGEIIGIIGKNGSGKSTLLKLISKIIKSKNNVYYRQQDIYTIETTHYWQEISLLWQNPENHFLYSSVSDELKGNHVLMTLFTLNEVAKQNPYCLSEGQKRRLSLAISIRPNIQLFLLDEPTFGQDLDNKQKLAELISSHALANKSFIIVSHDIAFLEALTNNIYNLDTGGLHSET